MGRLYLPPETLRGAWNYHPPSPLGGACASLARGSVLPRSWCLLRAEVSERPTPSWRAIRAASCAPRASWATPIGLILDRLGGPRLCAAAAAGPGCRARGLLLIVLRNSAWMPRNRPYHRRRSCRTCPPRFKLLGARPQGGRARSSPPSPADAAGPIAIASLGMTIDNGAHLLLSGNHAALDYLRWPSARTAILVGPGSRPSFRLSTRRETPDGRCASTTAACRSGFSIRPGAFPAPVRWIMCGCWDCCRRYPARPSAKSSPARGRSTGGWWSRCCWRRSTSTHPTVQHALPGR